MARIWNMFRSTLTTRNLEVTAQGLIDYRKNRSELEFYGCFENNVLIGFMHIVFRDNSIYLEQIATENTKHREGIGKQLLNYLENLIQNDHDKNKIELVVMIDNLPALNFFINHGFQIDSIEINPGYNNSDKLSENLHFVEYSMSKLCKIDKSY